MADPGELGSLGSKEPSFCSLNNRKMGVVWLKVGVFWGKLMKRTPLVRVLDPPLTGPDSKHVYYNLIQTTLHAYFFQLQMNNNSCKTGYNDSYSYS